MFNKANKNEKRQKRHVRSRRYVVTGETIAAASTVEKTFENYGGNVEAAKAVGKAIAEKALAKGVKEVVFDRGGYLYHGRVAALAEAAREAGLQF